MNDDFVKLARMLEEAATIIRHAAMDPARNEAEKVTDLLNEYECERLVAIMQFFDSLS